MKKLLVISVLVAVLVLSSIAFAEAVKNPTTITEVTIGDADTFDPAYSYDTASGEVIQNMYDNLIMYKGTSITEFAPMISTKVPSVANGLIKDNGKTFIFPIRKGVKFHDGTILTPQDVVYSFVRSILADPAGGPIWMFTQNILGTDSLEQYVTQKLGVNSYSDLFDKNGNPKSQYVKGLEGIVADVESHIYVDGDNVVFKLVRPYKPWLSIVSHFASWGAIVEEKKVIELGGWDGKADGWWKWHNRKKEDMALYQHEAGSGPYMLDKWDRASKTIVLKAFNDYWMGKPRIQTAIIKGVDEYNTRLLMLKQGDADFAYIPRQYINQVEGMPGISITKGLPSLADLAIDFAWEVNSEGNDLIGSGKLDGNGIPPNFFSDIHVRKGFMYAFPYDMYIQKVWLGQAIRNPGCIVKGLLGYNQNVPVYNFNIAKARAEFKQAWNGEVWKKGFKFTIVYNTGNTARENAAKMISMYVRMINPKFKVEVRGVQWPQFLDMLKRSTIPVFLLGWAADYPDPDDFAFPYMASTGYYPGRFGKPFIEWAKKYADPIIKEAAMELDNTKRAELYTKLQQMNYDYAIGMYFQSTGVHVQRSWVHGWIYNPMRNGLNFFDLWKQ